MDRRGDPALRSYAIAGGRIAFANHCAACHGAGGQGATGGYPSLADDDWLWGGDIAAIDDDHAHTREGEFPGDSSAVDSRPEHDDRFFAWHVSVVAAGVGGMLRGTAPQLFSGALPCHCPFLPAPGLSLLHSGRSRLLRPRGGPVPADWWRSQWACSGE